jgi:hypothetical protein
VIVVGVVVQGGAGSAASTMAVEIARRAAATGARTEIVGVAPPGEVGDRQLVELAIAGVGHATVTRSGAAGIEPADLDLALRYLPDVEVVALVAPPAPLLATAVAAAGWSGAALIVVGPLDAEAVAAAGTSSAIVLEPPARDPDGAFAGVVAALAARLDAGEDPAHAWQSTVAALAIDPA